MRIYTMVIEHLTELRWEHEFEMASDVMALNYAAKIGERLPDGCTLTLVGDNGILRSWRVFAQHSVLLEIVDCGPLDRVLS